MYAVSGLCSHMPSERGGSCVRNCRSGFGNMTEFICEESDSSPNADAQYKKKSVAFYGSGSVVLSNLFSKEC